MTDSMDGRGPNRRQALHMTAAAVGALAGGALLTAVTAGPLVERVVSGPTVWLRSE